MTKDKPKKYWLVAKYGSYGNQVYDTLAEAEQYAKQKAIQYLGTRFVILEAISTIKIDAVVDHAMEPLT